jgi:hypothetical protein
MLFEEVGEDTLSVELAKVAGGWLWHNDMTGSRPKLGLGCFNRLAVKQCRVRWRVLLVQGIPLHGVVHILWC